MKDDKQGDQIPSYKQNLRVERVCAAHRDRTCCKIRTRTTQRGGRFVFYMQFSVSLPELDLRSFETISTPSTMLTIPPQLHHAALRKIQTTPQSGYMQTTLCCGLTTPQAAKNLCVKQEYDQQLDWSDHGEPNWPPHPLPRRSCLNTPCVTDWLDHADSKLPEDAGDS